MNPRSLTWVHFGDLHMTESGRQNHHDFVALIDAVNTHLAGKIDFCFLPGDNADNGTVPQYGVIRSALDRLQIPLRVIPGDHDRESGNLDAFYAGLGVEPLPHGWSVNGYRCLFLDVVSAGTGGPDFRLSARDFDWLESQLAGAEQRGEASLLFMHTYPADLREGSDRLLYLLRRHSVLTVDMGHTHYNELANDGNTIYATTRSTGQVEEGPVGFSIMNVEGTVVSWRFKPLGSEWPFVMINRPADTRLATRLGESSGPDGSELLVVARAWSAAGIRSCRCRVNGRDWRSMKPLPEGNGTRWMLSCEKNFLPRVITVEAADFTGNIGTDSIVLDDSVNGSQGRIANGSDADRVGEWRERHILGTQLGPNRNGRHW
jgi:hypothetical protein